MARQKIEVWEESQVDFSGGIVEERNPSAFTERSLAIIQGFLFESDQVLRSQPACQQVSGMPGWVAIHAVNGARGQYLVGIQENGSVWYCVAPSDGASYSITSLVSWVHLFDGDSRLRFLVDNDNIQLPTGRVAALTMSHADVDAKGYKVYEDESTASLKVKEYSKFYPVDTVSDNVTQPTKDVLPPANQGVMLNSRLFLGDTLYNRDSSQPLSASNAKQYSSGVWFSESDTSTFYGLAYLYVASTQAQIRGMHVLDNKVIAITTAGPEGDGVFTFSGDFSGPAEAASAQEVEGNINQKILRGGTGAPRQYADRHLNYSTVWAETGTVCFVDRLGGIWSTEGQVVERVDRSGPKPPKSATELDHVAALGKHLFVARDGRLLVLTVLGVTGDNGDAASAAWTELITPNAERVLSMTPLNNSLYFIQGGFVYRYSFQADSERGMINGQVCPLTLGTRTHGDPGRHQKKTWHRFGLRFRPSINPGGLSPLFPKILDVTVYNGPVLEPSSSGYHSPIFNTTIVGPHSVQGRAGIGAQLEASLKIRVTGDVIFEEYSWTVAGQKPKE